MVLVIWPSLDSAGSWAGAHHGGASHDVPGGVDHGRVVPVGAPGADAWGGEALLGDTGDGGPTWNVYVSGGVWSLGGGRGHEGEVPELDGWVALHCIVTYGRVRVDLVIILMVRQVGGIYATEPKLLRRGAIHMIVLWSRSATAPRCSVIFLREIVYVVINTTHLYLIYQCFVTVDESLPDLGLRIDQLWV